MSETIKALWLTDENGVKIAPKTLSSQVINEDGTLFEDKVQASFDTKANTSHNHEISDVNNLQSALDGKADSNHTHSAATQSTSGFMSKIDKIKLDDIEEGAQVNTVIGVKGDSESSYRTGDINITKANIGLGNVDNTADSAKSVKYAISAGSATKSTQDASGNTITSTYETKVDAQTKLDIAKEYTDTAVAKLVDSAPETLNTLNELAAALKDDADIVDVLKDSIDKKANASDLISHTGNTTVHITSSERSNWNTAYEHSQATHARTDATKVADSTTNGNILINGTETNVYTLPSAGSDLGGVKSGGDVTISSGVITVKDDSHNHIISNIDNLQTLLDAKQATITGGATTITSSNLTTSRALVSDASGKVAVSAVTSTELGYLDGVTSNVQTQLDGKSSTSHTHNYAGASSAGGAATSANKLTTARTISLIGDVTGFASFDGSGDVSITADVANDSHNHSLLSLKSQNYKQETDLPSTYPVGETIFFSNKPENKFNNLTYCTVHTIKGYNSTSCIQYLYPYSTNHNTIFYRHSVYGTDVWGDWQMLISSDNISAQSVKYATSADSANSAIKATQDANGNVITATYTTKSELDTAKSTLQTSIDGKADSNHTHNYAGSSSTGGAASSANKLNTDAGSDINPVYFSNGVPVETTYTLGKSVPSDAKFTDTTYSVATTSSNGLMSSTDKKRTDSISGSYSLGNFASKTVADLQTALDDWLNSCVNIANASAKFSASENWVTAWNSGDTASTISAGGTWTVTNIAPYSSKTYAQLRISYYSDKWVVYVHKSNGVWGTAHRAAYKDDLTSKQNTITGGASTITSSNLTANRALISNNSGKVTVSAVTNTELGYLDGVTSNIQTQLDGKADSNHTHNYAGKNVEGEVFIVGEVEVTAGSGAEIFNDFIYNVATGVCSHVEGSTNVATGVCSHAEGYGVTAYGDTSHAEGFSTIASGIASHAAGYYTTADNYQYVVGKYNSPRNPIESVDTVYNASDTVSTTYPALFIIGNGTDDTSRSNAFTVYANGKCKGLASFGSSGADYARQYEWLDGNPDNEDRRGLLVVLDGSKIRIATPSDDIEDCEGIVSTCPAFVENDPDEWHDRYLKDIFGRRITQEVVVPEETIRKPVEKIDEETGEMVIVEVIEVIPEHTVVQFVVNPEYDPEQEYICRDVRPEWTVVGYSGFIVAVDDGTCKVNGYCTVGENGSLTMSETRTAYRVMERKDDNHILVRIK